MTTKTTVTLKGFQGLNTRSDPSEIEDMELAQCVNFDLTLAGSLKSRKGIENVLTTTGNVRILGILSIDADEYFIYKDDTGVRYTTDFVSSTLISATPSDPRMGVQYVDKFYIMDKDDGIYSWDGTTLTAIPSTPACIFGIVHKDRLFVCNRLDTDESRLHFSEPGDFTDFPGTNFIDVNPGDGEFLTSAAIIYDLLIVFKGTSTYSLAVQGSTEADWVLRKIEADLGCTSMYGTRVVDGALFFISTRGVYRTDGTSFREVTTPISNQFDDRSLSHNTADLDYLVRWEDKLICTLKREQDTKTYVLHLKAGGWTEWTFAEVLFNPITTLSGDIGSGLYIGGEGAIFRYKDAIYQDNGANFTCSVETKALHFEQPMEFKRGFWIGLDAYLTVDSTFTSIIDNDNLLQVDNVLEQSDRRLFKIPGPGYFRHWQGKLITYNQCEVYSINLVAGIKSKVHGHVR